MRLLVLWGDSEESAIVAAARPREGRGGDTLGLVDLTMRNCATAQLRSVAGRG